MAAVAESRPWPFFFLTNGRSTLELDRRRCRQRGSRAATDDQDEFALERLLPNVANWRAGPQAVGRHPSTYGRCWCDAAVRRCASSSSFRPLAVGRSSVRFDLQGSVASYNRPISGILVRRPGGAFARDARSTRWRPRAVHLGSRQRRESTRSGRVAPGCRRCVPCAARPAPDK